MYRKCFGRFLAAVCLVGTALATMAHPICAAESEGDKHILARPDSMQYLQEVVVTSRQISRTIATSQTLQGKELQALSNTSVADALKYFAVSFPQSAYRAGG